MQEGGWIKLHRTIRKHWLWEDSEKLKRWIDILLQANHQDRKVLIGNELINIERGSFHTSIIKIAKRWDVTEKTVKNFLKLLEKEGMITIRSSKKGTTIKVSNYQGYQGISEDKVPDTLPDKIPNALLYKIPNKVRIKSGQTTYKQELKNYKNYKNDEEGKEREEDYTTVLPSLSFPTESHKKIYDNTSDVTYRTWFIDTEIIETDNKITIKAKSDFNRGVIENRFKDKLYYIFLKEIEVL